MLRFQRLFFVLISMPMWLSTATQASSQQLPVGRIVALVAQDDHPLRSSHLVVFDPATGESQLIAKNLVDSFDGGQRMSLSVSADGRFAAVNARITSEREKPNVAVDLYLFDLATGEQVLVYDRGNVQGHAFSPDVSKLIFHDGLRIYVYDIKERAARLIMDRVKEYEMHVRDLIPMAGSDSVLFHASQIYFGAGPTGWLVTGLKEKKMPLAVSGMPGRIRAALTGNRYLVTIDFTSDRYDKHQLQFIDRSAKQSRRLADDVRYDSRIAVAPHEHFVLYTRANDSAVVRVEIESAEAKVVAEWGTQVAIAPDGKWFLRRDKEGNFHIQSFKTGDSMLLGPGFQAKWVPVRHNAPRDDAQSRMQPKTTWKVEDKWQAKQMANATREPQSK